MDEAFKAQWSFDHFDTADKDSAKTRKFCVCAALHSDRLST